MGSHHERCSAEVLVLPGPCTLNKGPCCLDGANQVRDTLNVVHQHLRKSEHHHHLSHPTMGATNLLLELLLCLEQFVLLGVDGTYHGSDGIVDQLCLNVEHTPRPTQTVLVLQRKLLATFPQLHQTVTVSKCSECSEWRGELTLCRGILTFPRSWSLRVPCL